MYGGSSVALEGSPMEPPPVAGVCAEFIIGYLGV
jgi:hypothetical protein